MANKMCVFCGEKLGFFQDATVTCGSTVQNVCKTCEKELRELDELEICRRALGRGLAENPGRIQERIELITEAENRRPKCLRCGEKLTFMKVQDLDNSPMRDSMFQETFGVLPAYCNACGKYEFYKPSVVLKDKYIAYLMKKDT